MRSAIDIDDNLFAAAGAMAQREGVLVTPEQVDAIRDAEGL